MSHFQLWFDAAGFFSFIPFKVQTQHIFTFVEQEKAALPNRKQDDCKIRSFIQAIQRKSIYRLYIDLSSTFCCNFAEILFFKIDFKQYSNFLSF